VPIQLAVVGLVVADDPIPITAEDPAAVIA